MPQPRCIFSISHRNRQTMTDRYTKTIYTEGELATAKVWNLSLFDIIQKHRNTETDNDTIFPI